jgi:hypothetical protein
MVAAKLGDLSDPPIGREMLVAARDEDSHNGSESREHAGGAGEDGPSHDVYGHHERMKRDRTTENDGLVQIGARGSDPDCRDMGSEPVGDSDHLIIDSA